MFGDQSCLLLAVCRLMRISPQTSRQRGARVPSAGVLVSENLHNQTCIPNMIQRIPCHVGVRTNNAPKIAPAPPATPPDPDPLGLSRLSFPSESITISEHDASGLSRPPPSTACDAPWAPSLASLAQCPPEARGMCGCGFEMDGLNSPANGSMKACAHSPAVCMRRDVMVASQRQELAHDLTLCNFAITTKTRPLQGRCGAGAAVCRP
jgi:hypothetical protein